MGALLYHQSSLQDLFQGGSASIFKLLDAGANPCS